jgi:hypothetical protein
MVYEAGYVDRMEASVPVNQVHLNDNKIKISINSNNIFLIL